MLQNNKTSLTPIIWNVTRRFPKSVAALYNLKVLCFISDYEEEENLALQLSLHLPKLQHIHVVVTAQGTNFECNFESLQKRYPGAEVHVHRNVHYGERRIDLIRSLSFLKNLNTAKSLFD